MRTDGMLKEDALKGQTIIITGGGTGLGRSMGKYMLEVGANLVITSRKMDVLEKAAAELEAETGGKVLPVQCDVRDYEQVESVIAKAEKEFGQINGLLNNAVCYGGNTQLSFSAIRLWNLNLTDCSRGIYPLKQLLNKCFAIGNVPIRKLFYWHLVYPCYAFVSLYLFVGLADILGGTYCLHQTLR